MKGIIRRQSRLFTRGAVILLIAILATVLAGCGSKNESTSANANAGANAKANDSAGAGGGESTEPVKVRFALDTAATGSLQFRTAVAQGFFKKNNIEPEVSNFAYGIDTINAMLVERSDTGSAADYALLNSLSKGDFKVVSTLSRETEQSASASVIIAKGDDIQSAKDLEGKKLGVVKGTVFEYIWSKYLENVGVDESKVKFVPYSTPDEGLIGMQKGQIDAVIAASIFIDKFLGIKGAHQIGDLSDAHASISSYFVVQTKFIEEHPETVANILKAVKEAVDYIKDHKEETAQLAFDEVKLPKEGVLKDLEQVTYTVGFTQEDYEHLEEMKTFIKNKGILKVDYDLKEKLALDPLRSAFPDLVTYK